MNLYAYVGGDPVNATDPSGLCKGANGKYVPAPTGSRICGGHGAASVYGGIAGHLSGSTTAGPGGAGGPTVGEVYAAARNVIARNTTGGPPNPTDIKAARDYLFGEISLGGVAAILYSTSVSANSQIMHGDMLYLAQFGGGGAHASWIPFYGLKDHWARHGEAVGARTPDQYHSQAVANISAGRDFRFRIDGEQRMAHITRIGADAFLFTSTTLSENRIFTHMRVSERYLSNIGITLPRGF